VDTRLEKAKKMLQDAQDAWDKSAYECGIRTEPAAVIHKRGRERAIYVVSAFDQGIPWQELAKELKVSRARIYQLIKKGRRLLELRV
jgi:hypothetical protein